MLTDEVGENGLTETKPSEAGVQGEFQALFDTLSNLRVKFTMMFFPSHYISEFSPLQERIIKAAVFYLKCYLE